MPHSPSAAIINRLLAALPLEEGRGFMAACEPVELVFSKILIKPDECIHHVYFPTHGFISQIALIDDARAGLEVGMIGDEGMLGSPLVLGVDVSSLRALVQGGGTALRMDAESFLHRLDASPALQRILKRYLHVVMGQLAQTAACNRFHLVEARLARWLLMTQDRAHSDAFHVTHEFLAYMLGVRRVGVTNAARSLQRRCLIHYHRGDVTILDRAGMEDAACGCYEADKAAYARTMESESVAWNR